MKLAATVAGICVLGLANFADAQDDRSLTNSGIEAPRVITGGTRSPARSSSGTESAPIEEQVVLLQNTIRQLTQSLANANAEAETYKRQAADLTLKIQTLGIAGAEGNEGELEQKLLAAVRDLRLVKRQNEEFRGELIRLSEVMTTLVGAVNDVPPEVHAAVEAERRKTAELLGTPTGVGQPAATEVTLSDAMVADVREDLSLIVMNVGEKHGVKIGMPFEIWRGNQKVGEARVVDVRERISGAVLQNLENIKNPVKTGDRLRVDARQ